MSFVEVFKKTFFFFFIIISSLSFLFAGIDEGKKENKLTLKHYPRAAFYRTTEEGNRKISLEPKIEEAFQNLFARLKESFVSTLNCYATENSNGKPTLELKYYSQKKQDFVKIVHQDMNLGSLSSSKLFMAAQEIASVCDGIEQIKALSPSAFQSESNDGTLYNIKVEYNDSQKTHFKSIHFSTDAPRSTASAPGKKDKSQKKEIKK
jgi:hypothetical protein